MKCFLIPGRAPEITDWSKPLSMPLNAAKVPRVMTSARVLFRPPEIRAKAMRSYRDSFCIYSSLCWSCTSISCSSSAGERVTFLESLTYSSWASVGLLMLAVFRETEKKEETTKPAHTRKKNSEKCPRTCFILPQISASQTPRCSQVDATPHLISGLLTRSLSDTSAETAWGGGDLQSRPNTLIRCTSLPESVLREETHRPGQRTGAFNIPGGSGKVGNSRKEFTCQCPAYWRVDAAKSFGILSSAWMQKLENSSYSVHQARPN